MTNKPTMPASVVHAQLKTLIREEVPALVEGAERAVLRDVHALLVDMHHVLFERACVLPLRRPAVRAEQLDDLILRFNVPARYEEFFAAFEAGEVKAAAQHLVGPLLVVPASSIGVGGGGATSLSAGN